nr:unnamed protein product [Callosobruchus analis]
MFIAGKNFTSKAKSLIRQCPNCGRRYKNQGCLSAHLSQDCGKDKSYSCNYCESTFRRKYHLKVHMIKKHHAVYTSELNER